MLQIRALGPLAGQVFHFLKYAPKMEPPNVLPYAKDRYRNEISRMFSVMDQRLAQTQYFADDFYAIADIASWSWASLWYGMEQILDDKTNLSRWLSALMERPGELTGWLSHLAKVR